MTRGRKRDPARIQKLKGNPSRRKINDLDFGRGSQDNFPDAPDFLDKYGRYEWENTGARLWSLGILHAADLPTFTAYCRSCDKWQLTMRELRAMETRSDSKARCYVLQTASGTWKPNPLLDVENKELTMMMKLGAELGLNPVARAKLGLGKTPGEPEKPDPAQDVFKAPNVVPIDKKKATK